MMQPSVKKLHEKLPSLRPDLNRMPTNVGWKTRRHGTRTIFWHFIKPIALFHRNASWWQIVQGVVLQPTLSSVNFHSTCSTIRRFEITELGRRAHIRAYVQTWQYCDVPLLSKLIKTHRKYAALLKVLIRRFGCHMQVIAIGKYLIDDIVVLGILQRNPKNACNSMQTLWSHKRDANKRIIFEY